MAKGQPFSVRLEDVTEKVVEAEARRTRRSKSAVVEAFTEETARTRRFPGIAFRGDASNFEVYVLESRAWSAQYMQRRNAATGW